MITKDELIEQLRSAEKDTAIHGNKYMPEGTVDTEAAHMRADGLLLEYINDPEVTEAFRAIKMWYA